MKKLIAARMIVAIVAIGMAGGGCSVIKYMTDNEAVAVAPGGQVERTPVYRQGDWIIARGSMHNHTVYSDGRRTPEDLLELARQEGMAVLAYTDHREGDICIKGLCLPINGVEKVGYETYLDHIKTVQQGSEDILVLIGVEVMPYFYNVGKSPHYVVLNQNTHFTVYDIDDPQVFYNMPARRDIKLKPEPIVWIEPYQQFVDYIVDHGGIVHAVHVESVQDMWVLGSTARFVTEKHPHYIHDLKRLTGFSVLPEAYHYAGAPGGAWDAALAEYLLGGRDQAPWAMADTDYHGPSGSLARGTTFFYMREFTRDEVKRCLRDGRMVAQMGASFQDCYVSEFSVSDRGGPSDKIMLGKKVTVSGPPIVRFSLSRNVADVKTRLIRNGEVVHETAASSFEYIDREVFDKNLPAVYRVEMIGPYIAPDPESRPKLSPQSELFTNPIFVYIERG